MPAEKLHASRPPGLGASARGRVERFPYLWSNPRITFHLHFASSFPGPLDQRLLAAMLLVAVRDGELADRFVDETGTSG
ncbi:hypothetical protein [Accumulibacter sp.]|uniref:hypothetical protein n=1 Tax=Accumulibacter sp. TaxID=2053492 RepID=UPI0025F80FC6|nr:hypothetical protein [Accumulibacter sp.]MCM8595255.1 hypothetical protein [Accumulibacter sp.]MDS4049401.1 hypothetical protein [Accumulibacter sp.]